MVESLGLIKELEQKMDGYLEWKRLVFQEDTGLVSIGDILAMHPLFTEVSLASSSKI